VPYCASFRRSPSQRNLSPKLKASHPEIAWTSIAGFRNVLVHDYLGIKLQRVWEIIEHDLPLLRAAAAAMFVEIEKRDGSDGTQDAGNPK
jgi:uncharacterized protein with HEPN domain